MAAAWSTDEIAFLIENLKSWQVTPWSDRSARQDICRKPLAGWNSSPPPNTLIVM